MHNELRSTKIHSEHIFNTQTHKATVPELLDEDESESDSIGTIGQCKVENFPAQ